MKESQIQIQIISYLSIMAIKHNIIYFSIPNEAFMAAARIARMPDKSIAMMSMHLKKMGMLPGVPDICILYQGETVFIEVKALGKKPSDKQLNIHTLIKEIGFNVYVVDNFEDAKKIIDEVVR